MSTRYTELKPMGIFLLSGILASSAFAHVGPDRQTMIQKATRLQIPFIENQGQVKDQAVRFYANTFAGTVFVIEKGEIVYNLQKAEYQQKKNRHRLLPADRLPQENSSKAVVLKETLEGAASPGHWIFRAQVPHCIQASEAAQRISSYRSLGHPAT